MTLNKYNSIFSIVLFVLFSGAFAHGAENLLKNGGFETIKSGANLPDGWGIDPTDIASKRVELDPDSVGGKHSIKISLEGKNQTFISQGVKAEGERDYVLKGWVKTSGKANAFFYVSFSDGKNQEIKQAESKKQSPLYKDMANWELATWKFSAPAGTKSVGVTLRNAGGTGEAWFDDVELNEVKDEKTDAGVSADWKLVFSDDFKSGKLEDNWTVISGKWSVKDGVLYAKGYDSATRLGGEAVIVCRKELGGNLRMEYTAWSDDFSPCDLSALLCVNPQYPNLWFSGYFFGFGSENNSMHKILHDGKQICRTMMEGFSSSIAKGKKYRVAMQRQDDRLSMFIDGKLELQTDDFASAEIAGRGCGFYIWSSGNISDVKVYALPDSNTGARAPEVKAEVAEHSGFESEKVGLPPESIKVDATGGAKAAIVNEPTWVYREDCEEFVNDNCVHLLADRGAVSLVKSFKPVNSGIVEFDMLAKKPGSEIKLSLFDEAKHEIMALVIDKEGVFFTEVDGERKKIDDSIEYRRRTVPTKFWFQPKRWFTLRIWFDANKGLIRSIGAVNLYTETGQPAGWGAKKEIAQGDYHQLVGARPLKNINGGITEFKVTASGDSDILFDNLCILGPVGTLRANGQNLMRPMRTVMGLDFPARKDPVELKIYSLRNTATKESFKSKGAQDWSGMSRLKVKQRDPWEPSNIGIGEKYATFTLAAAKTYNELLVRQAFVAENADMLERAAYYLMHRNFPPEADPWPSSGRPPTVDNVVAGVADPGPASPRPATVVSCQRPNLKNEKDLPSDFMQEINKTIAVCRKTEEFLGNAYQAYAHAYLNGLNEKELEEKFNPAAQELDKALQKAEQEINDVWKKMPENSLFEGGKALPCPMPVDKTPVVWKNGEWLRNGTPGFLFDFYMRPQPATEAAFKTYPIVGGPGGGISFVKTNGVFEVWKDFRGNFTYWMKKYPEGKFKINMATGTHYCYTYAPTWWLQENKDDQDIYFSDENGKPLAQRPLPDNQPFGKDTPVHRSLNFWNPKVGQLEYDMHNAMARWLGDNVHGKVLFFNLIWEAHNCAPGWMETGHNPSAVQAFRAFLQDKYKTIDVLNERWGTTYAAFSEIVPPKRGSPPSGVQYEFQRFRHKGYKDWILLCKKAIQDKLPDVPVQNDFQEFLGGSAGVNSFDMPSYCEMSDIVAYHSYNARALKAGNRWLDSLRKAYPNKAIGNHEWGSYQATPEMFDEENQKRSGLAQLFHRMMWGHNMSTIWNFHEEGNWTYGSSWVEPRLGLVLRFQAGYIPLHLDRASRLGGLALGAPSVQPDIGILEVSSSYYNALPCDVLRKSMNETAVALENKGYNYGIFYEKLLLEKKQSLKGVQLLIVPNGICLPKELCAILTDWVKNGGKLIASGALGVFNQYGRPDGTFLRTVFGEGNWEHNYNYNNWKPAGGNIKPVETIGERAIYRQTLGKGTVWLFNTADISDKILAGCLDLVAKNTDRSFFCKDNKFDLVMRESPGKTFLCMPISSGKKYLYVLNSSLNDIREDEIIVKGRFSRIGDLGLRREMNVPFKSEQGVTTIPLRLAPAEGTLLVLY